MVVEGWGSLPVVTTVWRERAQQPGVAGRAARWQRRAAKEAAQSRPVLSAESERERERETTIVNIEQLRAAASGGSAGAGAEADQPSPTLE